MGQLLLRIGVAVLLMIGVLALIGSFLPRDFNFDADVEIPAEQTLVYQYLADLKKWEEWSNWSEKISPDIKVEYGNQTSGKGASQRWTDVRGTGKLWITAATPPDEIAFQLEFRGFSEMRNRFELSAVNGGTKVRWASEGTLPAGPFYGYFGFLFESGMKAEYQKNLDRLKKVVLQSKQGG